jgi:hypothetical protein
MESGWRNLKKKLKTKNLMSVICTVYRTHTSVFFHGTQEGSKLLRSQNNTPYKDKSLSPIHVSSTNFLLFFSDLVLSSRRHIFVVYTQSKQSSFTNTTFKNLANMQGWDRRRRCDQQDYAVPCGPCEG